MKWGAFIAALLLAVPAHADLTDNGENLKYTKHYNLAYEGAVNTAGGSAIFTSTYDRSGVEFLRNSTTLTVGAGVLTLVACYEGTDATATTWAPCDGITTAGSTLAKAGASTPTLGVGGPFLGSTATGVDFPTGNTAYFTSDTSAFANFTTEDFVVELVARITPATAQTLITHSNSGSLIGWRIFSDSGTMYFERADNTHLQRPTVGPGNGWGHYLWLSDADHSGQLYANGSVATASVMNVTNTISNIRPFRIGASDNAISPVVVGAVMAIRVWSCAGCLTNADLTDEALLAKTRYAAVAGLLADRSVGSGIPTVMTRATATTVPIYSAATGITTMYLVGNNWMRLGSRIGTGESGYLSEIAITNKVVKSSDVSTTWTVLDAEDTIAAASADIFDDGISAWRVITGDATDGPHGVTQSTVATTAVKWTYSAFVSADGATPAAFVYLYDSTVANCNAYFSLSTCTVGTAGAAATTTHSKDYGGTPKICRVGITCTMTAATQTVGIQMADADGDNSTVSKTMGTSFIQMELAPLMTSYVDSSLGTSTRAADDLRYTCTGNCALPGTMVAEAWLAAHTPAQAEVMATQYGAAGDYARQYVDLTDSGKAVCAQYATVGGAQSEVKSAGNIVTGAVRTVVCSNRTAAATTAIWTDGVLGGADAGANTMAVPSVITPGAFAATLQANAFICRVSIYPATVTGVTR